MHILKMVTIIDSPNTLTLGLLPASVLVFPLKSVFFFITESGKVITLKLIIKAGAWSQLNQKGKEIILKN
jgi:hypothetical protein